jgi:hypothetical protein
MVEAKHLLQGLGFPQSRGEAEVLKSLIVEDNAQLATTLKYLVEDNPRYRWWRR